MYYLIKMCEMMLCAKMYDCQFTVYNSDVIFDKNM